MTAPELERLVIKDLLRLNIISSEEHIAQTDIKLVQYTYPIPTVNLESENRRIRQALEKENLFLLGRNGNWEYLNMDNVILRVKDFYEKHQF